MTLSIPEAYKQALIMYDYGKPPDDEEPYMSWDISRRLYIYHRAYSIALSFRVDPVEFETFALDKYLEVKDQNRSLIPLLPFYIVADIFLIWVLWRMLF